MKNVGDNALSDLPRFSAASRFNTQHNTLSSAYTDTFSRPLTLFTVNPYWFFTKANSASTAGLLRYNSTRSSGP
ncbi:MAG: hypothetical protein ABSA11_12825 [Candidatus Bathyarchaeia archaeon]